MSRGASGTTTWMELSTTKEKPRHYERQIPIPDTMGVKVTPP